MKLVAAAALLAAVPATARAQYCSRFHWVGVGNFQVRNVVREERFEMFKIGAAKTAFRLGLSLVATIVLAIASFKAAKDNGGKPSGA